MASTLDALNTEDEGVINTNEETASVAGLPEPTNRVFIVAVLIDT